MSRPHTASSDRRQHAIADEHGTLMRRAAREVVLCYPNTYQVAASSLGFQVVYRSLNSRPGLSCQRATLPPDLEVAAAQGRDAGLRSLEHDMALGEFDAILFSVAYELDLPHVPAMLGAAGLPPLAADRGADHPPVIAGGPLTQSNALPLGAFADVVAIGEAEDLLDTLGGWLEQGIPRQELIQQAVDTPGLWVPSVHGDAVPNALGAGPEHVPALGQWWSPAAEFKNMALLEAARGCPRYCRFCVVRAPVSPMRSPPLQRVVDALDHEPFLSAPRVGFVGAAVTDWPHIAGALEAALERGKGIGISSLRADRLDAPFVDLLRRGGYRTLTVASDAASQRLRGMMMKGLRERHLLAAAELAREAGMRALKMYVIVGLPEETDADLDELIDLGGRLSTRISTTITISPFVPKLHTPLADAPFLPIKTLMTRLKRIRRALGGRVVVRFDSPRQAWLQYRLSQGGIEAGRVAWQAWQAGGSFGQWRRAFDAFDRATPGAERAALDAGSRHALWSVSGAR